MNIQHSNSSTCRVGIHRQHLTMAFSHFLTVLMFSMFYLANGDMSEKQIIKAFEELVENTTRTTVPFQVNGRPLGVTVMVKVIDIRAIDEITNTFTVDMLLYLTW